MISEDRKKENIKLLIKKLINNSKFKINPGNSKGISKEEQKNNKKILIRSLVKPILKILNDMNKKIGINENPQKKNK